MVVWWCIRHSFTPSLILSIKGHCGVISTIPEPVCIIWVFGHPAHVGHWTSLDTHTLNISLYPISIYDPSNMTSVQLPLSSIGIQTAPTLPRSRYPPRQPHQPLSHNQLRDGVTGGNGGNGRWAGRANAANGDAHWPRWGD